MIMKKKKICGTGYKDTDIQTQTFFSVGGRGGVLYGTSYRTIILNNNL